jgi:hypothetical protein
MDPFSPVFTWRASEPLQAKDEKMNKKIKGINLG